MALLVASLIGIALGSINGSVIYFFNIPAIITTIATNNIFFGLLYVFSRGDIIYVVPEFFFKFSQIRLFKSTSVAGSPYGLSILTAIWIVVTVFHQLQDPIGGLAVLPAVVAGLSIALLVGLANGVLIAHFGVSPILATLGMMTFVD